MSDPAPEEPITRQQIAPLLPFLDIFERPDFEFGKSHSPKGELPFFEFSVPATNFQQALHENGWVSSFNWLAWQQAAANYVNSPAQLASVDAETIRKVFTTHVQKEQFRTGYLASMFENGHIVALLRRLKEIREGDGHL